MLRARVIPVLLLRGESLVKTRQFKNPIYIGDPCNTVRIFNELEVDELIFLDITASAKQSSINLSVLQDISNECFMPLTYGGGIRHRDQVKEVFEIGYEKIAINSYAHENPEFITQVAEHFGSQAVIGAIDVKRNLWGAHKVVSHSATHGNGKDPVSWAQELEYLGAGELMITSVNNEGTWSGYDLELIRSIADAVNIPVIANGGCGKTDDIYDVVNVGAASAAAVGSMVVFQRQGMGVLVNFPVIDPERFINAR